MKVNEIFYSIEGEGVRTGYPAIFLRLFGCNLHCSYCDTRYGCEGTDYTEKNIPEIIDTLRQFPARRITVTGGEPLVQPHVEALIDALIANGYEVNIETNGSVDIYPYIFKQNVIITMDWKTAASGMESKMLRNNLKLLRPQDVLKFVVGSVDELNDMKWLLEDVPTSAQVFVSPVFGMIEPHTIVEYLLQNSLVDYRVQVQLHKIIWDPKKRGV